MLHNSISRDVRIALIRGLANHRYELQDDYRGFARDAVLSTLASHTPGVDPVRRVQFFDSLYSQMRILDKLLGDYEDARDACFMADGIEFPTHADIDRLRAEATEDYTDALAVLLPVRHLTAVA